MRLTAWEARTSSPPPPGPLETPTMAGTDFLGNLLGTRGTVSQTQCESPRREPGATPHGGSPFPAEQRTRAETTSCFTRTQGWSPQPSLRQEPARLLDGSYFPFCPTSAPQDRAQPGVWGRPSLSPGLWAA